MHFKQIYSIPHYYTSKLSGWQIKKWGFVKVTTGFSYNRRYHSFSYSSSRLDPHSDYSRFWSAGRNRKAVSATLYRIKKVCSFVQAREPSLFQSCSLPSTSLRQSSLTARGRKLYALRMASGYWKTSVPPLQKSCTMWQTENSGIPEESATIL